MGGYLTYISSNLLTMSFKVFNFRKHYVYLLVKIKNHLKNNIFTTKYERSICQKMCHLGVLLSTAEFVNHQQLTIM